MNRNENGKTNVKYTVIKKVFANTKQYKKLLTYHKNDAKLNLNK